MKITVFSAQSCEKKFLDEALTLFGEGLPVELLYQPPTLLSQTAAPAEDSRAISALPLDTLDAQLTCKSNAHAFIANLINNQSIEPAPIRVEANSVNAFRRKHRTDLSVYGLRVRTVFGYQPGDPLIFWNGMNLLT